MKKYLICLAFTFLFSQTDVMSVEMINVESGAILIDMSNLDVDEKKDLFASLRIKTNKFILHSRNYSMEVQKIILMPRTQAVEQSNFALHLSQLDYFRTSTIL